MDFLELVKQRRSVRGYLDRAVEQSKIDYILECARLAPSAVNKQPWTYVVVSSPEARAAIRGCYNREWFATAPLYIVVCVDRNEAWNRPEDGKNHADIDAAITTGHLCLAAASVGLGTCWVCRFDPAEVAGTLRLPETLTPVVLLPVGYPADDSVRPLQRNPLRTIER